MCDIQHCIDVIPSAIILDKLTYHTSLKEHEEVQWQVKELMEKELVKESVNELCQHY